MLFKEFRQLRKNKDFSLITIKAIKAEHAPIYEAYYCDRHPILSAYEAGKEKCWADDYIIVNPHQSPLFWCSGVNWNYSFSKGRLECLIIIDKDNAEKLGWLDKSWQEFTDKMIKRYLDGEKNWYDMPF